MKQVVFWILLFVSTTLFAEKNVLVLHSYHHGLPWTDSISKGIIDTFAPSDEKINIYFEYLDSKRQANIAFLEVTFEYFLLKHQNTYFNAIIASDNDALIFMNRYQNIIFPDIPLVFCGINNFTPDLIAGLSQVTGIREVANYEETLLLAQTLFPRKNKVMVVLDDTVTGNAILEEVKVVAEKLKGKLEFYYFWDLSDEEIEKFMAEHKGEFIVYLLSYNRDKMGNFLSYDDSIFTIKSLFGLDVPVFGSWDFFLGKGIVGGLITTGFTQGQMAAELVLKILQGESPNTIPIKSNMNRDSLILDYKEMSNFFVTDPLITLPVNYINKPDSFFMQHRILILVGVISLCIVLIAWLLRELHHREKRRMQKEFEASLNHKIELAILQEEAQTDHLSGLLNRVTFESNLSTLFEKTKVESKELCFMMLDIDHFKNINDTYGHLVGDFVIQGLGKYLKTYFRKSDLIFRYGGEEFVVLLPDISLKNAKTSAEKLLKMIEKQRFVVDEKEIVVTMSIGLSMQKKEDASAQSLIARADEALYLAKRNGRNRVELVLLGDTKSH